MPASHRLPPPRACVDDPALIRPDWTRGASRPTNALWLDKNENLDPAMAALLRGFLADMPTSVLAAYPDAGPTYRKLAVHLGCDAANLLFTAGSDGAIRLVFEAFVSPGDAVIHTSPTFAMYPVYARMFGARAIPMEYELRDGGPVLPLDRLHDAIRRERPRLICLPNPDSPTGTALSLDELEAVIAAAAAAGSVILIDEAYHPFHDDTALPWIGRFPNLVVTRTFAKAWGMAGARVGFAAAHPEMATILHKMRPMYEVNGIGLHLVDRLLDQPEAMIASVHRLNEGKEWFLERMRSFGLRTLPSHGSFMHVAFGPHAAQVHDALDGRVLYRPDFDVAGLCGFSRFSTAPQALLEPVADLIANVLTR